MDFCVAVPADRLQVIHVFRAKVLIVFMVYVSGVVSADFAFTT